MACAGKLSRATVQAATGVGPATSQQEREDAKRIVDLIGIEHHWVQPNEHLSQQYRSNDLQRCFHCKTHLFQALQNQFPGWTIITGTNSDDLGDFRPGLEAAKNASVQAPLAELGISKELVRQLASHWQLPVADKPASPCLASRIAFGVEVTEERLGRVEAAEQYLKQLMRTPDCRVRVHHDELARIELPLDQIPELLQALRLSQVLEFFKQLGFRHVTVDLAGLRSGSLNPVDAQAALHSISLPNNSR
ncbi:MAG: ATP-dependent sacrificial sulfur transferase LarE [Pirellulales bacterium]